MCGNGVIGSTERRLVAITGRACPPMLSILGIVASVRMSTDMARASNTDLLGLPCAAAAAGVRDEGIADNYCAPGASCESAPKTVVVSN